MHHIYHTEGIILSSKNYGEAGRYYSIFTRELGMVYASAQGVRKMSSKLRFILQDFNYIKVDLVQGKDFWRITSASKMNRLEDVTKKKENFIIFSNIARLLKRLLAGIEPNEALFLDVLNGLLVLEKTEGKDELSSLEAILVLRILHNLGYVGGNETLQNFVHSPFEGNLIFEVSKNRSQMLALINKALKETHL